MNESDWLDENRMLRMDANLELFPDLRRRFHLSRYQFARAYCAGKRVLDGACGTGYGASILAEVASEVIGVDLDQETIDYASKNYGNVNTRFQKAFVEMTDFQQQYFDVVVSFETVEHTLSPHAHLREICRVLKPDGLAILSVPNCWGLSDHHYWNFDLAILRELVEQNFGAAAYFYNNSDGVNDRSPGIGPLDPSNVLTAECIVAVCHQPKIHDPTGSQYSEVMHEIYRVVFERHRQHLQNITQNTSLNSRTTIKHDSADWASKVASWFRRLL